MTAQKQREKLRISTDPTHKAYRSDAFRFMAFVDGTHQPLAITADEAEGYVELCILDEFGKPKILPCGNYKTKRINGAVEIRRKPKDYGGY